MAMDLPNATSQGVKSMSSINDSIVRLAAEALQNLRAGEELFNHCHVSKTNQTFKGSIRSHQNSGKVVSKPPQGFHDFKSRRPEAILSLLTKSDSLIGSAIGSAIGGLLSAYAASKDYCPGLESTAEFVEKQFIPVVNTVGSICRITGVEDGVRWMLGGGRQSDDYAAYIADNRIQTSKKPKKRKKLDADEDNDDEDDNDEDEKGTNQNSATDQFSTSNQKLYRLRGGSGRSPITDNIPAHSNLSNVNPGRQQIILRTQSQRYPTSQSSRDVFKLLQSEDLNFVLFTESLRFLRLCLGRLTWASRSLNNLARASERAINEYEHRNSTERRRQSVSQRNSELDSLVARIDALIDRFTSILAIVLSTLVRFACKKLPRALRLLAQDHVSKYNVIFLKATTSPLNESLYKSPAHKIYKLTRAALRMVSKLSHNVITSIRSTEIWCHDLVHIPNKESGNNGHNDINEHQNSSSGLLKGASDLCTEPQNIDT